MKYDPEKHHRKSIRLKGYDYSRAGAYFVTICVQNRECLFGEIRNGKMLLNDFGKIIDHHWQKIPTHFENAALDEYVIMPNHFHGVLWLVGDGNTANPENAITGITVGAKHSGQPIATEHDDVAGNAGNVGAKHSGQPLSSEQNDVAGNASPLRRPNQHPDRPAGTAPGSLSAVIQNFTSITSRKINRIRKTPGKKLWQRNFHDHIIRNGRELFNIRQYIIDNPLKWEVDNENPNAV
ncbi:MAG: hypothetical protein HUU32_05625 [Calditrichaceae bacterium]|nr:transposase [Calditrichia bacterium]NUQ40855.1 hypothetical protein [Calditrichaceae bacterium]